MSKVVPLTMCMYIFINIFKWHFHKWKLPATLKCIVFNKCSFYKFFQNGTHTKNEGEEEEYISYF